LEIARALSPASENDHARPAGGVVERAVNVPEDHDVGAAGELVGIVAIDREVPLV